jgi:hypothetical protein
MVDLAVLEAAAERRGSSSLPIRTKNSLLLTAYNRKNSQQPQFLSSAVERLVDIQEVTGSIPVETTKHGLCGGMVYTPA